MKAFLTRAVLFALGSVTFVNDLKTIVSFGAAAAENNALLTIPGCERTPVAYFGRLNGYDGGCYGYARADSIAAEIAIVSVRRRMASWTKRPA